MSRGLTTAQSDALKRTEQAPYTYLLEFNFSGGAVRYTTGPVDILWNTYIWIATGGLLAFGNVEETSDDRAQGVEMTLSGVTTAIIATLLDENTRGRYAQIWRANLDAATGLLTGDPISYGRYLMNQAFSIEEDSQEDLSTIIVKTRIVSRLAMFRQTRGIRTNLTSHQRIAPGDTFFQNVAALVGQRIYWGVPSPPSGPRPAGT